MGRMVTAVLLVLLVIYDVPFVIYGAASALWGIQPPTAASPAAFLAGVLITKIGTAVAFVALFAATRTFWISRWPLYAAVWFVMFVFSEMGDAVAGRGTALMAVLGIAAEAIYLPISAVVVHKLLKGDALQSGKGNGP